ncbi:hypothetical protein [Novosphingobium naphthalenivorans]|uniref:hypothetical protein n=1 Tax=Novosphingobium naphthalenivorans TaxID=273168 RepID=UPI00082C7045|nr:hypothetical protein [Novosphingobium naphthalenivorans]
MNDNYLQRRHWYVDHLSRVTVTEDLLRTDPRSKVVLAEAGMGKSTLLEQLSGMPNYAFCAARKLTLAPDPSQILGDADTIVIDALDEVSARWEAAR